MQSCINALNAGLPRPSQFVYTYYTCATYRRMRRYALLVRLVAPAQDTQLIQRHVGLLDQLAASVDAGWKVELALLCLMVVQRRSLRKD